MPAVPPTNPVLCKIERLELSKFSDFVAVGVSVSCFGAPGHDPSVVHVEADVLEILHGLFEIRVLSFGCVYA
jgi:hypothetical protein